MPDPDARIAALEQRCKRLMVLATLAAAAAIAALALNLVGKLNKTLVVDELVVDGGEDWYRTSITNQGIQITRKTSSTQVMAGNVVVQLPVGDRVFQTTVTGAQLTFGNSGSPNFIQLDQLSPSISLGDDKRSIYLVPKLGTEPPRIEFNNGAELKKTLP